MLRSRRNLSFSWIQQSPSPHPVDSPSRMILRSYPPRLPVWPAACPCPGQAGARLSSPSSGPPAAWSSACVWAASGRTCSCRCSAGRGRGRGQGPGHKLLTTIKINQVTPHHEAELVWWCRALHTEANKNSKVKIEKNKKVLNFSWKFPSCDSLGCSPQSALTRELNILIELVCYGEGSSYLIFILMFEPRWKFERDLASPCFRMEWSGVAS